MARFLLKRKILIIKCLATGSHKSGEVAAASVQNAFCRGWGIDKGSHGKRTCEVEQLWLDRSGQQQMAATVFFSMAMWEERACIHYIPKNTTIGASGAGSTASWVTRLYNISCWSMLRWTSNLRMGRGMQAWVQRPWHCGIWILD